MGTDAVGARAADTAAGIDQAAGTPATRLDTDLGDGAAPAHDPASAGQAFIPPWADVDPAVHWLF